MADEPLITDREQEILVLLAQGLTWPQIGKQLFITVNSCKTHYMRLSRRVGVNGQVALVNWAWQHGYVGDRWKLLQERADLLAKIEALTNTVENLRTMYTTAAGFKGWQP